MTIWQGIFLGIIQGLTEFLPVSSSGHLLLFQKLFGLKGDFLLFDLILHLATLLAVIIVFRKQVFEIIKQPFGKMGRNILIASIPTFLLALLLKDLIKNPSSYLLGFCFLITALLLFISNSYSKKQQFYKSITTTKAFTMGAIQGLACFPGISRSGSTISAGLFTGASKNEVADFSFLMSIPVILGGFVFELIDTFSSKRQISFSLAPTLLGFVFAFIFGMLAICFMLKIIKKSKLSIFGFYLVLISLFCFLYL